MADVRGSESIQAPGGEREPFRLRRPTGRMHSLDAYLEAGRTGEYGSAEGTSGAVEMPATLGPFRLERRLGQGGQAVVYAARDQRDGRRLALKLVPAGGPGWEETLLRFQREARVLERLAIPGIARVYEAGVVDDVAFLGMELVEGESLARHLERVCHGRAAADEDLIVTVDGEEGIEDQAEPRQVEAPLPDADEIGRLVALVERVASALHAVHQKDVLHRDIKPGNIMVTPSGEAVLVDFGVARELDDAHATLTRTGALSGTPAYMSPEQLTGQRIRLDARTDLYSLAVTLYELVTLCRPFRAPSREGLYQAILAKAPCDPRRLNPAVPRDLVRVLERAMERDRDLRHPSAAAFAEDLRRVRAGQPILSRRRDTLRRTGRLARRHALTLTAVACLVLGVAMGFTLARTAGGEVGHAEPTTAQAPEMVPEATARGGTCQAGLLVEAPLIKHPVQRILLRPGCPLPGRRLPGSTRPSTSPEDQTEVKKMSTFWVRLET